MMKSIFLVILTFSFSASSYSDELPPKAKAAESLAQCLINNVVPMELMLASAEKFSELSEFSAKLRVKFNTEWEIQEQLHNVVGKLVEADFDTAPVARQIHLKMITVNAGLEINTDKISNCYRELATFERLSLN